jgi:ArsR family transcriptional regulator
VLVVVDFAPHLLEFLRDEHAHHRLGFTDAEVGKWCQAAGLDPAPPQHLIGDPLTVAIWTSYRPATVQPETQPDLAAPEQVLQP